MPPLYFLISYAYWTKEFEAVFKKYSSICKVFLDSGAFTAYHTGKKITVEEYCNFVDSAPIKFEHYFTLDVIGDSERTEDNLRFMLQHGLKPVPIFTRGTPIEYLDDLFEVSDVVGLGGLTANRIKSASEYLKWVIVNGKIIEKKRQVHWLGFAEKNFLLYFKPYSCDSSSYNYGFRFGDYQFYPEVNTTVTVNRQNVDRYLKMLFAICSRYDLDPSALKFKEAWYAKRGEQNLMTTLSLISYTEFLTKIASSGIKYCSAVKPEEVEMICSLYLKIKEV
jgi:hypothetical protein